MWPFSSKGMKSMLQIPMRGRSVDFGRVRVCVEGEGLIFDSQYCHLFFF